MPNKKAAHRRPLFCSQPRLKALVEGSVNAAVACVVISSAEFGTKVEGCVVA
jgi:hypothetical protein